MADNLVNDLIVWRCTNCGAVQLRFEHDGRPRSRCVRSHSATWPVRWKQEARVQTLPFFPRPTPRAAPARMTTGEPFPIPQWGEQLALAVGA